MSDMYWLVRIWSCAFPGKIGITMTVENNTEQWKKQHTPVKYKQPLIHLAKKQSSMSSSEEFCSDVTFLIELLENSLYFMIDYL